VSVPLSASFLDDPRFVPVGGAVRYVEVFGQDGLMGALYIIDGVGSVGFLGAPGQPVELASAWNKMLGAASRAAGSGRPAFRYWSVGNGITWGTGPIQHAPSWVALRALLNP
jgi:hypothetical protein